MKKLKLQQRLVISRDKGDDEEEDEEDYDEEYDDEEYDDEEDPLFSREDPYTEEEQKAIDQYGFLFPDYCVCQKPFEAQMTKICQREAALMEDPSIGNIYPQGSDQIEWVFDTHTPYDFCYDEWQRNGVLYSNNEKESVDDAGDDFVRPEQTQAEKDFYYWQNAFTSNIKWDAYNI